MKFVVFAVFIALAVARPTSYKDDDKYKPTITIVSLKDSRKGAEGSGSWSSAGSDGATREESTVQKEIYGKNGNTNKGVSVHYTPDGQKITLAWEADERGFVIKEGDHLPTPPPIPEEIAKMLPLLPKLVEKDDYTSKPLYRS